MTDSNKKYKLNLVDVFMSENRSKAAIQRYILKCFQCGVCTGSCPVSSIALFNPRKIAYKIVRGVKGIDEIWYCLTCYTCEARCPSCVKFTEVIIELREDNIKIRGDILDIYKGMLKQFLDYGLIIKPISTDVENYLEKLKLKQNLDRGEFRKILREIFRKTKFQSKILEWGVEIDEN